MINIKSIEFYLIRLRVEPAMTPETDYESIPFYKIKKPGMTPSTDKIAGRVLMA